MIASFIKYFTENDKNTICIVFQFHNPKLRQEGCFKQYVYYATLCRGRSTKEQNDCFLSKALERKSGKYNKPLFSELNCYIKSGDVFYTLPNIWD